METKQTTVEWLYDKIKHGITKKQFDEFILEAKEIEMQQIVMASASAYEDMFGTDGTEYGEEYYNNTFKKHNYGYL